MQKAINLMNGLGHVNKLRHFFPKREDIFLQMAYQYNLKVFDNITTNFADLMPGFCE